MPAGLLTRLDARDRSLFIRWARGARRSAPKRRFWIAVTSLGSAVTTVGLVVVPLIGGFWPRNASWRTGIALLASHLLIQGVKRMVGRDRPSAHLPGLAVIANPDRFSFPSGHAASSLAVALGYSLTFPAFTAPFVAVGLLVGWSRVMLGVHYPGDVLAGQTIAMLTVLAMTV